jgi:hypothetical protein
MPPHAYLVCISAVTPNQIQDHHMPSLLRVLSAFCLVSFACIGLMVQFLSLDVGRADLFFGIAALLGLLLWLTRDDCNGASADRRQGDQH